MTTAHAKNTATVALRLKTARGAVLNRIPRVVNSPLSREHRDAKSSASASAANGVSTTE